MADTPLSRGAAGSAGERAAERARLTFRRLSGLDRSGPPPARTLRGQPLNPWTLPNAIGLVRLALIPVFLALAFATDGAGAAPAIVFAVIAWSDYADGIAARLTGQYSRFGALLDPVVDRLLILSGLVVCWHFELLPHWALAVLVGREALTLVLGRLALRRGLDVRINWPGRLGVWPVMSAVFFAIVGLDRLAEACLYVGLVLVLWATALYVRDGLRAERDAPSSSA